MRLLDLFRKKQVFTKDFGIIRSMIGIGRSEKNCKEWKKTIHFMTWPEVTLLIRDKVNDDEEMGLICKEFDMMLSHQNEIAVAIAKNERFCILQERGRNCMKNTEQVVVELHLKDEAGNRHPYVSVAYSTDYDYVYLVIEQGALSAFTAEKI